tara:strand:+ start:1630 stop:1890 length:261 start_codon:yes stop_codon:yes gene_type:complete
MKIALITISLLLMTGCAQSVPVEGGHEVYGFFYGLLHGMLILFSLIGSLLDPSIAVYGENNNGFLYDLGFAIGIVLITGKVQESSS